jgi:hypothetical protein
MGRSEVSMKSQVRSKQMSLSERFGDSAVIFLTRAL